MTSPTPRWSSSWRSKVATAHAEIHEHNKTVSNENLIGWTRVDAIFAGKPRSSYPFWKGTARNAMASGELGQNPMTTSSIIDLEVLIEQQVKDAINLFPSSVMAGCDELLPGLKNDRLPNTVPPGDINLLQSKELFLERVSLVLSPDIIKAVRDDCKRFRTEKYGGLF